ncbi:MAG: hypothetical protein HFJ02_00050 [Bacilli bacterium]|nr:hypothetical protein [Bacilli bacterium]
MDKEEEKALEELTEEIIEEEANENSSLSNETRKEKDVKDIKAKANEVLINKLLKSPITWIIVGLGFFVFFVAILIYVIDIDLSGKGNTKPGYYPSTCSKVYWTWERSEYYEAHKNDKNYEKIMDPSQVSLGYEDENKIKRWDYKEFDFDTYITNVVWTDNEKANVVDNQVVYQTMSIAARSFLVATLSDNCVVLSYNNPQNFTELDGTEEHYQEINETVRNTRGLIIGRNQQIIKALYDPFSYVFKRSDGNEKEHFYHMMQKNNEEQQRIPATWVDEHKNIPISLVSETKYLTSMSLYGAKYLEEHKDFDYDIYRLLKYYYGQDIEFYTIDYEFSEDFPDSGVNPDCSEISMTKTSLSKEEFIALAQKYTSTKGKNAQILGENAGMIYDMGVANGVNPELVFIRADVEGYSPGSSKNNYWGMGCTNTGGYDACITYSSLADGVSGFLKNISKYKTLTDLMSKYAYLGKYWYNPGSWSMGGCVYASSIYGDNIPERVKNACASGKICNSDGSGDCVLTTDEDHQAYLKFQSKSMLKARRNIFGLDAEICPPSEENGYRGSCTIWKQGDPRWGKIRLGSSKTTMSKSGCLVTSVAIAMTCSGTQINNASSFTPGALVNKLNATNGFNETGGLYWDASAIRSFAPNFIYVGNRTVSGSPEQKVETIKQQIASDKIILLHFTNIKHLSGHWVVLKSITDTTFTVYDPAGNEKDVNNYQAKDLDRMAVYRFS